MARMGADRTPGTQGPFPWSYSSYQRPLAPSAVHDFCWSRRTHLAHAVVVAVGDVQVSLGVEDAAVWAVHAGLRRGAAVAAGAFAAAGHGGDEGGCHFDLA